MKKLTDVAEIAQALLSGKVGVVATDTVYGLAASAYGQQAVSKIYELKGRENKPGTIIAASLDQLNELGIDDEYLEQVKHFWPGAVSVIVPYNRLDYLHLGKNSLAVRVPNDDFLAELLLKTGPLLTSSANLSGKPTANTITEASAYFGDSVDFYVDGGDLSQSLASTIVQVSNEGVKIIRQGAVKL